MNIEPNKKIESSFLLKSNDSCGSGIMEVTSQACTLKDSDARLRFDAVMSGNGPNILWRGFDAPSNGCHDAMLSCDGALSSSSSSSPR